MYPPSILGEKSIREIETTHLTHLPRSLLSPLPTLPKRGSSTLCLPLVGSATFSRLSSRGEERRARKSGDRDREETRRRTFGCAARSGRKRRVRVRWRVGIDPARVRGPQGGWVARRKPGTGARGGGGRRSGDGWRVWREGRAPPVVTRPVPRARVQLHLLPPCV